MRLYISSYSSDCACFKCQYDITLAVYSVDKYLDNISANLALSEPDKQRARALFEKKFLS